MSDVFEALLATCLCWKMTFQEAEVQLGVSPDESQQLTPKVGLGGVAAVVGPRAMTQVAALG